MMKRTILAIIALSAFFLAGCNDFLSEPPGSVEVNLQADPAAVPGSVDCAISWKTNVETKHILEYGTETGVYTVATPLSSAESTDHAATLSSLLPSTTYYYRVRSYYRTYQEANSAEFSFTTGSLTSITITAGPTLTVGQTSCDLAWTTNVPTKHAIEYGTVTGTYTASTVLSGTAATAHSASVTGLSPATTYYYRIRSTYQNGLEGLSAEANFTTNAGAASLSFTTAPAATPALTSASVAYATNYATVSSIEYGTASGVYTESLVLDSSSTSHTRTISGLAEGTTYYYVVHCYSASNGSVVSPEYSFTTTAEAAPTLAQRLRGIWLVGGCSGANWTTPVQQIDMYDPVTSTWYPSVATMPAGRATSFAAAGMGTYNGHRVLVIAGGFDSTGAVVSTVLRYDIEDQAWLANGTPITATPTIVNRANVVGAVRNNNLYVIGGTTANAGIAYASTTTDLAYDIGADTWGIKIAVATGSDKATVAFNDTILYSGGRTAQATVTNVHDGVIVSQNVLTTATEVALPTVNRTGHSVVSYTTASGASVLVVLGGFSGVTGNTTCFVLNGATAGTMITANTVQYLKYPFTQGAWIAGTNLPANVAFGSAVVYGNTVYYFGGTDTYLSASGRAVAYSMQFSDTGTPTNTWGNITMPVGRYGHAAVRFE